MDYRETNLHFLEADCIAQFGGERGVDIYKCACDELGRLLAGADDRNSKAVRGHMETNMMPTIAYYKALLQSGFGREEAYGLVLQETQKAARKKRDNNRAIGKLPFAYAMFRRIVGPVMAKSFPAAGWETQWIQNDRREVHFNLCRCIYQETTVAQGCPELCTVFCQNDDTHFAGFLPNIRFARDHTLAEGGPHCDFHFTPGKRQD